MMKLSPLGDQAILAHCDDESAAGRLAAGVRRAEPDWLIDVVPAYASVAVFFDPARTRWQKVSDWIAALPLDADAQAAGKLLVIPCCYELGPDLARVSEHTKLPKDRVIELHTSAEYMVYAVGFCPGFPYLGYVPTELSGVPRLDSPRLRVEPGSVGLTGRQTGIYPLARPGGWNLIGRTPCELVNLNDGYFALEPGDRVRFSAIDSTEYQRRLGERFDRSAGVSYR